MLPISAITGINNAASRFERASQQLIEGVSGISGDDPARAIVDLTQAKTALKAGVQVLRAADQMTGALLDMIA
jgi:flagellin-like hook-associated protein FlgL